jgi:hypothetical protein
VVLFENSSAFPRICLNRWKSQKDCLTQLPGNLSLSLVLSGCALHLGFLIAIASGPSAIGVVFVAFRTFWQLFLGDLRPPSRYTPSTRTVPTLLASVLTKNAADSAFRCARKQELV